MIEPDLVRAVAYLAERTHALRDTDLEQPWRWRAHEEGVRFALIGAYHELRELAVRLALARAQQGPPLTAAQRTLAPYLAGYHDLQAVLLGVTDALYDQEPAPGEWPLRYILGHIAGAQRHFFTLVHYGLARQRDGEGRPVRLPSEEVGRVTQPDETFDAIMMEQGIAAMRAFYEALHQRTLREFAPMTDEELQGPSLWWEGEAYSLQYRLHRFDAHLRQHTVQAEKTLTQLGYPPNEARRLLRLIFQALAEVEATLLGAATLEPEAQQRLAKELAERADRVVERVQGTNALIAAIVERDLPRVQALLASDPALANAVNEEGLPAVLVATYNGRQEITAALVEAGAELNVFAAAAVGRLDKVQEAHAAWPGWINEYARDGFTPLQLACYFGHEAVARWLIEQGADVNAAAHNALKVCPLHAAAANGNVALVQALLATGADPNARQQRRATALHTAAGSGNRAMAELLVAHGADPRAQTDEGKTPLALALEYNHTELAAWLRQQGGQ